jgi:hypothetical protein
LRAAYVAAQRATAIDYDLLAELAEKEYAAAGKLFQHVIDVVALISILNGSLATEAER